MRRSFYSLLRNQSPNRIHQSAGDQSAYRGQKKGQRRKRSAARLPANRQKGGGAGPVHQTEQDHAEGGQRRPPVGGQQLSQRMQRLVFRQGGRAHISHHHDGNYRFVGGESQNKGQEDDPVHTEDPSHGIQNPRQVGKDGDIAQTDIGQKPNDDPGRGGYRHRSTEDEDRAIQNGADDHRSYGGTSVGRQFQSEGGW